MKNLLYGLIVGTTALGMVVLTCTVPAETSAGEFGRKLIVDSPVVKLDTSSKVSFIGSGFTPGQEICILFTDVNGVQADIGYALKPEPKVNKHGAWYTTWSPGRYIKRKLIKEGAYIITITDKEYNPIVQAPVAFYKEEKKKKKKK